MADTVAQTVLFAQDPRGNRQQVRISVGFPIRESQADFVVHVQIDGLRLPGEIHGSDSFQALSYALVFVRAVLRQSLEDGWQFFGGMEDQQPFDFEHYWFGTA